jgi:HAMP domain-containing protein
LKFKDILPEVLGVLFALIVLNLWYVSSLAIEHRIVPSTYDYFLKAVVVLFAAFFGSFSAFYLNTRKENLKEIRNNVSALNAALFVTLRQINALLTLKKAIKPLEKDPIRFLKLPAMYASDYSDLKVDLDRMELLLEDHPNLLLNLSVEQGRFESAVKITNMRAEFHHEDLQKALNDSAFSIENPTLQELVDAVGPRIIGSAMKLTDGMYDQILLSVDSLTEAHEELFEVAKKVFPNQPFIKFQQNT